MGVRENRPALGIGGGIDSVAEGAMEGGLVGEGPVRDVVPDCSVLCAAEDVVEVVELGGVAETSVTW